MPNHAKLNTVREHASAVEYDLGRPLAQNTSHVQNPLRLVDDTPQLHDASGTITTMRAWNPKGSGNGIQYQDTKSLYESPFGGSFATSTIYPDSSDTTSSSNLIANPDKLTDWTLDSQGNWVDSLSVNSPTGGDATTDGNVNFFDLTTLGAHYGSSDNVRWRNGDFDGDGSVNFYDQTTLSANYGASGGNVGTLQTRSTNAANEITSVSGSWVTPTYDAAGNMVSAPKAGAETTRLWYVYDAWNRQVIVKNDSSGSPGSTLATYSYDGLNRRITKAIAGGDSFDDYFNENWQRLESRKNGDADPLDQFLWDLTYIDTPVLRWHDANTDGDLADLSSGDPDPTKDNTLYYTTDANHNVTALYDADQERVIERYVYDPYGKTFVYDRTWGAISSSAVDNDVQWGGYVSDKETGNKLARNRYYGVPLATWMARDSAGYVDGANLLQYVGGNPEPRTDPSGLQAAQSPVTVVDATTDLGAINKSQFYDVRVKWNVPAGYNGQIIQHITRTTRAWDCKGNDNTDLEDELNGTAVLLAGKFIKNFDGSLSVKKLGKNTKWQGNTTEYWESWTVNNGVANAGDTWGAAGFAWPGRQPDAEDIQFRARQPDKLAGSYGWITMEGDVLLTNNMVGAMTDADHQHDMSGSLPSTINAPGNWAPAQVTLHRTLTFWWCECGDKSTWKREIQGTEPKWHMASGTNPPPGKPNQIKWDIP